MPPSIFNVTTASKARIVTETDYHISLQHLAEIRERISENAGCMILYRAFWSSCNVCIDVIVCLDRL